MIETNTQVLKPNQLAWCCAAYRIGENYVFAEMQKTQQRIKEETEESRRKANVAK